MCISLTALSAQNLISPSAGNRNKLIIENRVLARIDDRPISVIDVMKKMSIQFYLNYPHLLDSELSRFQFYKAVWRDQLDKIIDDDLIAIDADLNSVTINDGEVRQELEKRFGPQIILTLEKIGLTYDEAWNMVKNETLAQHMLYRHLYFKGICNSSGVNVSPNDLLTAFHEYMHENKKPDHWKYHIISFTGPNALENVRSSQSVIDQLQGAKNFSTLSMKLKDAISNFDEKNITISDEIDLASNQILESHRNILLSLDTHNLSEPLEETSRVNNQPVYRVFYLSSYSPGGEVSLSEVEQELMRQLRNQKHSSEQMSYVTSLRERYGLTKEAINDSLPQDFEPFQIR